MTVLQLPGSPGAAAGQLATYAGSTVGTGSVDWGTAILAEVDGRLCGPGRCCGAAGCSCARGGSSICCCWTRRSPRPRAGCSAAGGPGGLRAGWPAGAQQCAGVAWALQEEEPQQQMQQQRGQGSDASAAIAVLNMAQRGDSAIVLASEHKRSVQLTRSPQRAQLTSLRSRMGAEVTVNSAPLAMMLAIL